MRAMVMFNSLSWQHFTNTYFMEWDCCGYFGGFGKLCLKEEGRESNPALFVTTLFDIFAVHLSSFLVSGYGFYGCDLSALSAAS